MMWGQKIRRNRRMLLSLIAIIGLIIGFAHLLQNEINEDLNASLVANAEIHAQSIESAIEEVSLDAYIDGIKLYSQRIPDERAVLLVEDDQIRNKAVPEFLWTQIDNQAIERPHIMAIQSAIKSTDDEVVRWKSQGLNGIAYRIGQADVDLWIIESLPEDYFKLHEHIFWLTVVLMLVLISVLTFIVYREVLQNFSVPLEKIESGVKGLLDSNETIEYINHDLPVVDRVGQTLNQTGQRLLRQRKALLASQQQLSVLLDHINLGVVVVNRRGLVELFNPTARKLLALDSTSLGKSYESVIKSFLLINMIKLVGESGEAMSDEVEMFIPTSRYIDVNIVPFTQDATRMEGSVLVLLYDVTEIHRLETVRSEFVANASHELRTPVTSIKGFAETLQAGALKDPEKAETFIGIIANESQRLETIINDILELSRVEKRAVPVINTEIDLVQVAHDMADFFRKKAKKKNISIAVIADKPVIYRGDKHRIEQILTNLIDNAINYSDLGDHIDILLWDKKRHIKFAVKDTGMGIPEENKERIFERFYRVDKGRSRNSGGTGLGLSIVRNLIKNMNGKLDLDSEVGKGSTFSVTLPKN